MPYTNLTGDPAMCSDISNRPDIVSTVSAAHDVQPESFKGTLDKVTADLDASYVVINKIIDFLWGEANPFPENMNTASFRCMDEHLNHASTIANDIRSKLNIMADRLGMD